MVEYFDPESPRWPLTATLIWIATRDDELVRSDGNGDVLAASIGFSIHNAMDGTNLPSPTSVWPELAANMDGGKLFAFGTCTRVTVLQSIETSELGQRFPPDSNPGSTSSYVIESDSRDRTVLRPEGWQVAQSFVEWRDITFNEEDIKKLWPPTYYDLQSAITLLAHGEPMALQRYMSWLAQNDASATRPDQETTDPQGLNLRFQLAWRQICDAARSEVLEIFARPPAETVDGAYYPNDFGDYQKIPADTFIAQLAFGPNPQSIYYPRENPYKANWFYPRIAASQFNGWRAKKTEKSDPKLTALQADVLHVVAQLWPDKSYPARVSDRNNQIRAAWPNGSTPPSDKTITRALKR